MKITLVKKILASGKLCPKCEDVLDRLEKTDQMSFIDQVLIADERDPESEGLRLAKKLGVERAPFFVVEDGGDLKIYTVYFKFAREVLNKETTALEKSKEILKDNIDLDYI